MDMSKVRGSGTVQLIVPKHKMAELRMKLIISTSFLGQKEKTLKFTLWKGNLNERNFVLFGLPCIVLYPE